MDKVESSPEPLQPRMIRAAEDRLDWQENREPGARTSARRALVVMIFTALLSVAAAAAIFLFAR